MSKWIDWQAGKGRMKDKTPFFVMTKFEFSSSLSLTNYVLVNLEQANSNNLS